MPVRVVIIGGGPAGNQSATHAARLGGDVTLVDPGAVTLVDVAQMVGSADWTPYQGMRLRGRVVRTILRGMTVAQDGKPVGHPGVGRFVRRTGSPLASQRIAVHG